jgi:hypothetical protein
LAAESRTGLTKVTFHMGEAVPFSMYGRSLQPRIGWWLSKRELLGFWRLAIQGATFLPDRPFSRRTGTLSHEVPGLVYFDRSFGSRQHL